MSKFGSKFFSKSGGDEVSSDSPIFDVPNDTQSASRFIEREVFDAHSLSVRAWVIRRTRSSDSKAGIGGSIRHHDYVSSPQFDADAYPYLPPNWVVRLFIDGHIGWRAYMNEDDGSTEACDLRVNDYHIPSNTGVPSFIIAELIRRARNFAPDDGSCILVKTSANLVVIVTVADFRELFSVEDGDLPSSIDSPTVVHTYTYEVAPRSDHTSNDSTS